MLLFTLSIPDLEQYDLKDILKYFLHNLQSEKDNISAIIFHEYLYKRAVKIVVFHAIIITLSPRRRRWMALVSYLNTTYLIKIQNILIYEALLYQKSEVLKFN